MKSLQLLLTVGLLQFLSTVSSEDIVPTFKYVTSYLTEGRYMTAKDIERTSVNVLKPIIFLIDGLTNPDKQDDAWSRDLQDAYLEKFIHNVFIVDWDLTSPVESGSINKAHSVGLAVADFIATIFNKTGEAYLEIHLVGVSLGCEVAASAARRFLETFGRKINRITGLDPAYYSINGEGDSRLFSAEYADLVDVVLTDLSGTTEQIGHVDFYVDREEDHTTKDGDYLQSTTLFAKSINTNEIKAKKCDSAEDFRKGECDSGEEVTFGENVGRSVRGKYFLNY